MDHHEQSAKSPHLFLSPTKLTKGGSDVESVCASSGLGSGVGSFVGSRVGIRVGLPVGLRVGLPDGSFVGRLLGALVGGFVGYKQVHGTKNRTK